MGKHSLPQHANAVNNPEYAQMDRDLAALRSRQEHCELADLDAGLSYEDWQELYGLDNAPGYAERRGRDY